MGIHIKKFRVAPHQKVDLKNYPTSLKPLYGSNEQYQDLASLHIKQLSSLQDILYADNRYSLLLIFQAMDAAGKDSVIKHVMSGVNPQDVRSLVLNIQALKNWSMIFSGAPRDAFRNGGRIGIFNRSYYEEVLIVRVHPQILQEENIPQELLGNKDICSSGNHSINDLEKQSLLQWYEDH